MNIVEIDGSTYILDADIQVGGYLYAWDTESSRIRPLAPAVLYRVRAAAAAGKRARIAAYLEWKAAHAREWMESARRDGRGAGHH